jgi:hypothetical protein
MSATNHVIWEKKSINLHFRKLVQILCEHYLTCSWDLKPMWNILHFTEKGSEGLIMTWKLNVGTLSRIWIKRAQISWHISFYILIYIQWADARFEMNMVGWTGNITNHISNILF